MSENINSNDLFLKNLRALNAHHPDAAMQLKTPAPFQMEVISSASGLKNLYIYNAQGERTPVYPVDHPLSDLPDLLAKLEKIRGKILCFCGVGLGIHAVPIVKALGGVNLLLFAEAHPAFLKTAMTHTDLTGVFSHPNVRLAVGQGVDFDKLLSGERDRLLSTGGCKICRFYNMVASAPRWYREIEQQFQRYMNDRGGMDITLRKAGRGFFENRFKNLMAMACGHPTDALTDKFQGVPAIIVASGPSLSKNITALEGIDNRALIIAVDSAVGPLIQKAITPHVVASVDRNDFTFEKLAPFVDQLHSVGLVFVPEVTAKIPNYIRSKTQYYTFLTPFYRDLFNDILGVKVTPLKKAQAVNQLALDTAQKMGCDPIVFVGLDLSFPEGRDHVEGTILHWGNRLGVSLGLPEVEDIHGNMVPTSPGFINILTTTEQQISDFPARTYIDATEGGVKIRGTRIMPLSEAIAVHCTRSFQVSGLHTDGLNSGNIKDVLLSLKNIKQAATIRRKELETYFYCSEKIDQFIKGKKLPDEFHSLPQHVKEWIRTAEQISMGFDTDSIFLSLNDIISSSHIDEYRGHKVAMMAAEDASDARDLLIASHEQQKFIQQIRNEALDCFVQEIERQIQVFDQVLIAEEACRKNSQTVAAPLKLAETYYGFDYLAKADDLLAKLSPALPHVGFLSGCIKMKQGDVGKGKKLLETAAWSDSALWPQVNAFMKEIQHEWFSADGLPTFRKLMIDRILSVNPLHFEAKTERLDIEQRERDEQREYLIQQTIGKIRQILHAARYDEGLEALMNAVKLYPKAAILWEELGDTLFQGGDYATAAGAYENCLATLPERVDVFRKIGDCYLVEGKIRSAEVAYQRVLEKDPDNAVVQSNLAKIKEMKQ